MICRTTISGTFETGQTAVRIYVTEREGGSAARLQLFLPVRTLHAARRQARRGQGNGTQDPFTWCLTNTCIAGDLARPRRCSAKWRPARHLAVEVVDTNLLAVTTSLPLGQFAAVRKGAPAQVFEQQIDE